MKSIDQMSVLRGISVAFILCLFITYCPAPPVDQKKPASDGDQPGPDDPAFYNLEYERYLQEVVQVLESDPEFRAKLEKANPDDVKSGKIAEELDFLHHDIRSKLNEIKRREVDRLRQALREQMERENGVHNLVMPTHLDHENLDTFEKEDLKKLIHKTTKDLEELDAKRREEFKEYEMQKEIEFRKSLANMTEEQRANATKQREEAMKRHEKHPEVKHPGSKAQLEEVWEDVDKLPKESFDPKTFFQLHDLTGDGFLDISELEALFQKELDKVYDKNNPDDDMRERDEEMSRMREHVMKELDANKDGLISIDEFLNDAKKPDFNDNEGWETLDKKKVYSEEDLRAFAEQWAKANGAPMPYMYPPYGGGYPGQHPPGGQQYPGGHPQQYPGGQQQYPGQYPQGGQHPGQFQGQYPPYPNQGYPQQQQFQQPPQQQQWGQVPQQGYQGQPQPGQPHMGQPIGHQQPPHGQPMGQPVGSPPAGQPPVQPGQVPAGQQQFGQPQPGQPQPGQAQASQPVQGQAAPQH